MALIRPNNRALQNITTLPTGITEYNLGAGDLPEGSVLQVITRNGRQADITTTSSSPVVMTDCEITITPISTSSRIFVTWYGVTPHIFANSTVDIHGYYAYRGATSLGCIGGKRGYAGADSYIDQTTALAIIDHPNTTSATTYYLYAARTTGNNTSYVHRSFVSDGSDPRVRIVAMEINMSTQMSS